MEKKVSWLELFYDLIFVAAFIQLGNALAYKVTMENFLVFAGLFVPLWTAWTGFSFYMNRYNIDDFTHRLLAIVQMFAVGAMAVSAPLVLKGKPTAFALSFAIAQAMVAIMYARASIQQETGRQYSRYWGGVFGIGAVLWLVSIALPSPWIYLAWGLAVGMIFVSPFSQTSRTLFEEFPIDFEHLSERYGLLTIIVLGESFVKMLSGLSGDDGMHAAELFEAGLLLLLTCGVWWIYFDDVAGSHLKRDGGPMGFFVWLYGHLPLQLGIVSLGVAVKKAVAFDLTKPATEYGAYCALLAGTLALVMLSVAIIDSATERRQAELSDRVRVGTRIGSALLVLMLIPVSAGLSAGMFVGLVTAVLVAQVVFDMMMAPMSDTGHGHEAGHLASIAGADLGRTAPVRKERLNFVDNVVRKGTPSELRHDLYFYFMHGSWFRFLGVLAFFYIAANVFFAGLYMLRPGCIAEARPESFGDAFAFSVQTMSTIGFGVLHPANAYANFIVTIEAAFGLGFTAFATGLMFAKVSRPEAAILFSRVAVIREHEGQRTLLFRIGNARGNEVVDASLTMTVMVDEPAPDGTSMLRLHELEPVRSRTPVFSLTWTVMHRLDADSVLSRIDPERLRLIMVTINGYDSTYGSTIYARHSYAPEDLLEGHRLVDIDSYLEDGRLLLDYGRFHDTVPISST